MAAVSRKRERVAVATRRPNTFVQRRVLLALRTQQVSSVTALARALDAPRPSVSRILHLFCAEGLATKQAGAWKLTETGMVLAHTFHEQQGAYCERLRRRIARLQKQLAREEGSWQST